jgi:hypothetical protein
MRLVGTTLQNLGSAHFSAVQQSLPIVEEIPVYAELR